MAQRFTPCQAGFDPGIAVVPSTATVFVGAGTRLLGCRIDGQTIRLWEDTADLGFWHWSVHPGAVLMAAELELAAWDLQGTKLWRRFVEPRIVERERDVRAVVGSQRSEWMPKLVANKAHLGPGDR